MLNVGDTLHGCRVTKVEDLPEIDGSAIEMAHDVSGVKLLYLKNEDPNKAFSIAFPTPPVNDTGVFHILEHSVLCGSDKFPVKEPFVNLLKSSMQTFLNAVTFPDKTVYPVASTNEQDLLNLIDVYLDAVLNPVLYRQRQIFEQEGWHYELEGAEDGQIDENDLLSAHLKYNGVVFNEMKGALADPESVMYHAINRSLFPQSCYAFESGGHPRAIPQLTYEDYCDTHARHYRLDNSFIVLYGDMDIDRVLEFLDTSYLSKPQRAVESGPNPVGALDAVRAEDTVVTMDTAEENACVGIGYVIGDSIDSQRVMACDVMIDALMGGNEAPLKRALLEAGLGGDYTAYLVDAQAKPFVLFLLKNAKPGVAHQFREILEKEVRTLVEQGIPRDVLDASLSQMTFTLRERDRGMADGVVLAMGALAGWLYSDDGATRYLRFEEPLAAMREGLDNGYFEQLLDSLVLQSNHCGLVDLQVAPQTEDAEAAELASAEQDLTDDDRRAIVEQTNMLRVRQEAPDAPEDLAKLPQLHISDIGDAQPDPVMHVRTDFPSTCLHHTVQARHINYLRAYFDLGNVAFEELPYVTVLSVLLGHLETEHYSASELDTFVRSHLGDVHYSVAVHVREGNPHDVRPAMMVFASALAEEVRNLADLPREIWETTRFTDAERIRNLLVQQRIALEEHFVQAGHLAATRRVQSYLFPSGKLYEQLAGVDYYRFLCDTIDSFDETFDPLVAKLEDVRKRIFVRTAGDDQTWPLVSFTGTEEELEAFWREAGTWNLPEAHIEDLPAAQEADVHAAQERLDNTADIVIGPRLVVPAPQVLNEAFTIPSDVNYTAQAANVGALTTPHGRWSVLQRVMAFDYLWNEIRVKGGAYGCGFRYTQQGRLNFHSYRDPQIDATLARFNAAGSWLADFNPTHEEWEGYVVSTVAGHDAPVKPRQVALRQAEGYLVRRPSDYREQRRAEYLATTPDMLRDLASVLDAASANHAFCTFGNAEAIAASSAPYKEVIELLGS